MSSRPILSRPRTKIYDANYNIGQNYYRPALDRLDRKYSGRPLSPPPRFQQPSLPQDLLDRHERAFFDDDLPTTRRRAEKVISEPTLFDSRGGRISQAFDLMDNNFDEETTSTVQQRIRANKKVAVLDDVNMDSTVGNLTSRRIKERADKILDSVGITEVPSLSRRAPVADEDVVIKRRSVRIASQEDTSGDDNRGLLKWSSLSSEKEDESMASARARQSKARLNEIEEEMTAMAEKQAARERRAARLRALVAEFPDENEGVAAQSVRISARQEERTIEL